MKSVAKMAFAGSLAIVLSNLFSAETAQAYPEFIGYGYASCVTCHYNGLGGGPLNDYGRALWSAEIAAHPFYAPHKSDEEVATDSGFLGSVPLPYWIRPHLKYRALELQTNPNPNGPQPAFYQMQADYGVTVAFDEDQKYLFSGTMGYAPANYGSANNGLDRFWPTEYYFRVQPIESWFVYVGLLEKAYGLRTPDHESYQRAYQGFQIYHNNPAGTQNSQSVILQKIAEKWELALDYFFGSPYEDVNYIEKGGSVLFEFDVAEKKRLGFGLLSSTDTADSKNMAEIHYKQAVSKGSSLLAEYGLIQDQFQGKSNNTGSYNLLELMINVKRGYNLVFSNERYSQLFNPTSPDQWRWMAGVLMWPIPRVEIRFDGINGRNLSTSGAPADSWFLEGQVHVSL